MRRLMCAVAIGIAVAVATGGCDEITNTIRPNPGTANPVTVALDAAPNVTHAGIYAAAKAGYFTQTDLDVTLRPPAGGADPLDEVYDGTVDAALSTPPAVLRARNEYHALVAVAAVVQTPQPTQVTCTHHRTGTGAHVRTTTTCRATPGVTPPAPYTGAPTYPGLVVVVTKSMIVNHAPIIRRLVQAIARGYELAALNPRFAAQALVAANPALKLGPTEQAIALSRSSFFPPDSSRPWGWLDANEWSLLGNWMTTKGIISVANASVDVADNELLAGQGV